jgi:hypothetical protein
LVTPSINPRPRKRLVIAADFEFELTRKLNPVAHEHSADIDAARELAFAGVIDSDKVNHWLFFHYELEKVSRLKQS